MEWKLYLALSFAMFMEYAIWGAYAKSVASEKILSTMQALMFAATTGLGLLLGTQLAGAAMDKFKSEGKFQWRQIFMVPAAIALVCIVALALLFTAPAS